jgi:hypothetical protein
MPTKISDALSKCDLLTAEPATKRTMKFDIDASGKPVKFTIDGKTFDRHRVDIIAKLGTKTSCDSRPFNGWPYRRSRIRFNRSAFLRRQLNATTSTP